MGKHRSAASQLGVRGVVVLLALAALCGCAALLAGCGGSSAGASAAATSSTGPSVSAVPSPVITSGAPPAAAVAAVREYWSRIGVTDISAVRSSCIAPGSPLLAAFGDDIASARLVRVLPHYTLDPPDGATMRFGVDVWVKPTPGPWPWGDTGTHTLFVSVTRMSDGSWRMWDVSTSP